MDINDFKNKLVEDSKAIDVQLGDTEVEKICTFIRLMKEWNEKINLTSITEDEEIISKHLIDSLTLFNTQKLFGKKTLIDIGTGAGFPAIPLKICNDELEVTLLDSVNKRLKYLNEVIDTLDLKNIFTVHSRAEDGGKNKDYREMYDIATARAVATLAVLAELCLPFVKVGGYFICMKGPAYREELIIGKRAIEVLGGKLIEVLEVEIPGTDYSHNILVIEKIRHTPPAYPRNAGIPSSSPIK